MDSIEDIVKGLTVAERQAVLIGGGPYEVVTSKQLEPLWYMITKRANGFFAINLTPRGQSVRDLIQEPKP